MNIIGSSVPLDEHLRGNARPSVACLYLNYECVSGNSELVIPPSQLFQMWGAMKESMHVSHYGVLCSPIDIHICRGEYCGASQARLCLLDAIGPLSF